MTHSSNDWSLILNWCLSNYPCTLVRSSLMPVLLCFFSVFPKIAMGKLVRKFLCIFSFALDVSRNDLSTSTHVIHPSNFCLRDWRVNIARGTLSKFNGNFWTTWTVWRESIVWLDLCLSAFSTVFVLNVGLCDNRFLIFCIGSSSKLLSTWKLNCSLSVLSSVSFKKLWYFGFLL